MQELELDSTHHESNYEMLEDITFPWHTISYTCLYSQKFSDTSPKYLLKPARIGTELFSSWKKLLDIVPGRHNLRSFLAANSTQNYFLIAYMISSLWHSRQKCCIYHWDNYWYRKWIEREEIKRKWGKVESESLSISSFSLYFLSISSFSLHFLFIFLFSLHFLATPLPQFVQPCIVRYQSSLTHN